MQHLPAGPLVVETNWTVLNNKPSFKVCMKIRRHFDMKWIYIPSITAEIKDSAAINHLRPIASLTDDLNSINMSPLMYTNSLAATIGIVSLTNNTDVSKVYYGTVFIIKEGNSFHIIYYINTPITIPPGIYTISDVYLSYI